MGLILYYIIKIFVSISIHSFQQNCMQPRIFYHKLPSVVNIFFLKKHEPYIFVHRYFLYIFSVLRNLFIVISRQNFLAEPF